MRYLRVTAKFRTIAIESAWWCFRSTGRRWLENRFPAVTADLLKNGFSAIPTGALVTEFKASMIAAFERPSARPSADVLGFDLAVQKSRGPEGSQLAFDGLSIECLAFPGAATVATFVASTVEGGFAMSRALWLLFMALVANCRCLNPPTSTSDRNGHEAGRAVARVADPLAGVSTIELL